MTHLRELGVKRVVEDSSGNAGCAAAAYAARAGIVSHVPRIIAVQAVACAPLARAFEDRVDEPVAIHATHTAAEGIAIATPMRGSQMLAAVCVTGGSFVAVSEQEILASLRDCCRGGWFIEPTSAAVIAGARRYSRTAAPGETVVTAFTGHGLKSAAKVAELVASL
jgi:threonine synthase